MKVNINQMDEELNEKNADLTIQQLKKENDQLVNIYHGSRARRISVGSQTKQVGNTYLRMYVFTIIV